MEKLFSVPLVFLFIASCIGLFLRYQVISPVEGVVYSYVLHAHSHVMFLGWVFNVLILSFTMEFAEVKGFKNLFWLLQFCMLGILISFPIQGYNLFSITFSTLHSFTALAFIIQFFRATKIRSTIALTLAKAALLYFALSSIGPFFLGYPKANALDHLNIYRNQKRKTVQLKEMNLPLAEYERQFNDVVSKECLCIGLSNAAIVKYSLPPVKNLTAVTICPGPNIAYFNKTVSLKEMTDHIYGRTDILGNKDRPHMFLKELQLNVQYLQGQAQELKSGDVKQMKDLLDFGKQLLSGIEYYRGLSDSAFQQSNFGEQLNAYENEVLNISREILERFDGK